MNRLIVMTGATGGIGSEILSLLGKNNVCCLSRRAVESAEVCFYADFSSSDYSYIEDLKSWIESKNTADEIVLILAASTITPIDAIGSLQNSIQSNININVTSQALIIDAIVFETKKYSMDLRIIYFDSGAAYRPINGWSLYCSSKSYVSMFLGVLAKENPKYKIVRLDPGVVDTDMQTKIRASSTEAFVDRKLFLDFKTEGKLNNPKAVAQSIYNRYLINWNAKSLNERFYDFETTE